jgi:hypothetical protein
LFSPTLETLCKAIDNGQLIGFPHITSTLVDKYLPDLTAIAEGHLNRIRHSLCSTYKTLATTTKAVEADYNPPAEQIENVELFIGATIGKQNDGTIYTDQTGNFPVRSYHGKKCQFIAYDYCSNAIFTGALKDQTDKSLVDAFQDV